MDKVEQVRVEFAADGTIVVMRIGRDDMNPAVAKLESECTYDASLNMPVWIQKHIAVLSLVDWDSEAMSVPDVVKRIGKNVFWLFAPTDEEK